MKARSSRPVGWVLALALAGLLGPSASRADITSTFDAGDEGWMVVDYPFRANATGVRTTTTLPFDAANGSPAGSVRVGDVYGETGIAAPAAFLGDLRAYQGGSFSYDILIRYSDNAEYPAIVLASASLSLYYDAPSPLVGTWEHRVVPLAATGWKVGGTTADATPAQFLAVLQNLTGIYLYTEWHTGDDDTNIDNVLVTGGTTSVELAPARPFNLACYPNPFNPRTTIRFDLRDTGTACLAIYDLAGRLVRILVDEPTPAGDHEAIWDGRDAFGREVGSGTYLVRLALRDRVETARIGLVR